MNLVVLSPVINFNYLLVVIEQRLFELMLPLLFYLYSKFVFDICT